MVNFLHVAHAQFLNADPAALPSAYAPMNSSLPSVTTGADSSATVGNPGIYSDAGKAALADAQARAAAVTSVRNAVRTQRQPDAFERYVESVSGRKLRAYGSELFEMPPSTFAPVDGAPVTDDYVLGAGDEVLIRAWGSIDIDYKATVDRSGAITLPRVATFQVAGLRASELNRVLRTQLGKLYSNFQLNVTVGRMRAIRVYAVGQAQQPGAYTLSGVSTLLSAVFASGGPSASGSMRHIQLRRNGLAVSELDMYQFLLRGEKAGDVRLLDGDVIVYAPVGDRVALLGSTAKQAIYELADKRETLGELIAYSGGLSVLTDTRLVQIERFDAKHSAGKQVDKVTLDASGNSNYLLRNGDLITLTEVTQKIDQAVTLRGNVQTPLRYPYFKGMRIRDLIPNKEALITEDYYQRSNILVQYDKSRFDAVAQSQQEYEFQQQNVASAGDGPVRLDGSSRQRTLRRSDVSEQTVSREVRNIADDINWDYATIQRLGADLKMQLIPFNLGKAILQKDEANNLLLQPGDVVTIYSTKAMRVAQSKQTRFVRLEGEFAASGIYQAEPGETLRQLVARVGGLLPTAYLYAADFRRESARQEQQKAISERADRMERDLQAQSASRAGSGNPQDTGNVEAQLRIQRALLDRYRNTQATGRLVMDLPDNPTLADLPDVTLEDGDVLYVPARTATVHVLGAVYNENSFIHKAGKGLNAYVDQAGGTTEMAKASDTYVIRADGAVVRQTGNWSFARNQINPGDTIVVPENLDRFATTRNLRDWTQIFYQFALGVASIKVLKN